MRTKLLGDIDQGRRAGKKVTVAEVIQAWLDTSEHELTTRRNYQRTTTRIILPALGQAQARKVDVETLDRTPNCASAAVSTAKAWPATPSARSTSSSAPPSASR